MKEEINEKLKRFLDKTQTKVAKWPSKNSIKILVLEFLSDKFKLNKYYTEKEINAIINNYHTFSDPDLLRRELYDKEFFDRELDGSKYWKLK